MRLDHARELKASLMQTLVRRPEAPLPRAIGGPVLPMRRGFDAGPFDFEEAAPVVSARATAARELAVGLARRNSGDYRLAVRAQRASPAVKELMQEIRAQARGEVDERITGPVTKQATTWRRRRFRPLRLGSSVAHLDVTAGTLGCFVRMKDDDRVMILSNNHVLANENEANVGDAIVQPSPDDGGGDPADVVARLVEWVELDFVGRNVVDCAVAVLETKIKHARSRLTARGPVIKGPPVEATLDEKVIKLGRTTERREGIVTSIELDKLLVEYDRGVARFDDQIEIEGTGQKSFSDGGDSGSLIVNAQNRPVALLFAGSEKGGSNGKGLTFANPLEPVLAVLEVDLL